MSSALSHQASAGPGPSRGRHKAAPVFLRIGPANDVRGSWRWPSRRGTERSFSRCGSDRLTVFVQHRKEQALGLFTSGLQRRNLRLGPGVARREDPGHLRGAPRHASVTGHRNVSLLDLIPFMRKSARGLGVAAAPLERDDFLSRVAWPFVAVRQIHIVAARLCRGGRLRGPGFGVPSGNHRVGAGADLGVPPPLLAGLRFLLMDVKHSATTKSKSKTSARVVLAASIALTLLIAAKLVVTLGATPIRGAGAWHPVCRSRG